MEDISSVIAKVNKLQSLSKSSNANEAAAAAAAANRLIDKFRLSQADFEAEKKFEEPIIRDTICIYESKRVTMWKTKLIHVLTRHYGVAYYMDIDRSSGHANTRYLMIGRTSDLFIVRYMYNWLLGECDRLAAMEAKGNGRVFVASYQEGFVAGVGQQLNLSREEVRKEAISSAMVKIDSRYEESREKMYDMVPGLRPKSAKTFRRLDYNAYGMGKDRGQSISLGGAASAAAGVRMLKG